MPSISFTGPQTTVTISRAQGTDSTFWFSRLNNTSKLSVSGNILTYDGSTPTMLHGVLTIKYVNKSEADVLRSWIANEIKFALHPFSITPNFCDDLGLGIGAALPICKIDGVMDTSSIFIPHQRADKLDIALPYIAQVAVTGGVAEL